VDSGALTGPLSQIWAPVQSPGRARPPPARRRCTGTASSSAATSAGDSADDSTWPLATLYMLHISGGAEQRRVGDAGQEVQPLPLGSGCHGWLIWLEILGLMGVGGRRSGTRKQVLLHRVRFGGRAQQSNHLLARSDLRARPASYCRTRRHRRRRGLLASVLHGSARWIVGPLGPPATPPPSNLPRAPAAMERTDAGPDRWEPESWIDGKLERANGKRRCGAVDKN